VNYLLIVLDCFQGLAAGQLGDNVGMQSEAMRINCQPVVGFREGAKVWTLCRDSDLVSPDGLAHVTR